MAKFFRTKKKQAARRRAIRAAVKAHREALNARGLVRVETTVDTGVAAELRARAKAAGQTLREFIAQILRESVHR